MLEKKRWTISDLLFYIGTTLAVLGIIFIGIFIGNRLVPYSFIGVGVLLQIISYVTRKLGQK